MIRTWTATVMIIMVFILFGVPAEAAYHRLHFVYVFFFYFLILFNVLCYDKIFSIHKYGWYWTRFDKLILKTQEFIGKLHRSYYWVVRWRVCHKFMCCNDVQTENERWWWLGMKDNDLIWWWPAYKDTRTHTVGLDVEMMSMIFCLTKFTRLILIKCVGLHQVYMNYLNSSRVCTLTFSS